MKTNETKKTITSTETTTTNNTITKKEDTVMTTTTNTQKADNPIKVNSLELLETIVEFECFVLVPSNHFALGRVKDKWVVAEGEEYIESEKESGWDDSFDNLLEALDLYNGLALLASVTPEGFEDRDFEEYERLGCRMANLLSTLAAKQNRLYFEELKQLGYTEDEMLEALRKQIELDRKEWEEIKRHVSLDTIISKFREDLEYKVEDLGLGHYRVTRPWAAIPEVMTEQELRDEYHFTYEE